MNRYFSAVVILLLMVGFYHEPSSLCAQAYTEIYLLEGKSFSEQLQEPWTGFNELSPYSPLGDVEIKNLSGKRTVVYTGKAGVTGTDTLVYEYWDGAVVGSPSVYKVKSYIIHLQHSILTVEADFTTCQKNDTDIDVNVLLNDNSTSAPLKVTDIRTLVNVSASVQGDSVIRFSPDTDYVGPAYIDYRVCDGKDRCQIGVINIAVMDTASIVHDSVYRALENGNSLEVLMPSDVYVTSQAPVHGMLKQNNASYINYKPNIGYVGPDSFIIEKPGYWKRSVFVHSLAERPNNSTAIDDVIFLAEGQTVDFNVFDNDVSKKLTVRRHTEPAQGNLIDRRRGRFRYTPPAGYSGLQEFTYTVCPTGGDCEVANVQLIIHDAAPESYRNYELSTKKNQPIVLSYHVPLKNYNFFEKLAPVHGTIDIYAGQDSIEIECDTAIGYNQVIYTPDPDFVGMDEFEVEYCINSGNCVITKIEMEVIDEDPGACPCIDDCVWSGDVNMDGRVTMSDLLPLGWAIGRDGPSRSSTTPLEWSAQDGDTWNETFSQFAIDMKHCDTDGDGKVHSDDTMALVDNYYREHSFVEKDLNLPRRFPFKLELLTPDLDSGDIAMILISIGDLDYPIYDLNGLAYAYNYNPEVFDSASMSIDFFEDGWFGDGAATLDMYKQPWLGRIEAGFVRTGNNPATGFGRVALLTGIIVDDITGIRGQERIPIEFTLSDGMGISNDGELFGIPSNTVVAYLNLKRQQEPPQLDPDKLILFPNPSSGQFQMALNGRNSLLGYEVYSMTGQPLLSVELANQKQHQVRLDGLTPGQYIIRVLTELGPITKKIFVAR